MKKKLLLLLLSLPMLGGLSASRSILPSALQEGDEIVLKTYDSDGTFSFVTLVEGDFSPCVAAMPAYPYRNLYFSAVQTYDPNRSVLIVDKIHDDGSYTFRSKFQVSNGLSTTQDVYLTAGPSSEVPDNPGINQFIFAAGTDDRFVSDGGPALPGFSSAIAGSWQEACFRWRVEEAWAGRFKMRSTCYDAPYGTDPRNGWLSLQRSSRYEAITALSVLPDSFLNYTGLTIESPAEAATQSEAQAVSFVERQALLVNPTSITPSALKEGDEITIKTYGSDGDFSFVTLVEGDWLTSNTDMPAYPYRNLYFAAQQYDPIRSVLIVDKIHDDGSYTFRSMFQVSNGLSTTQDVYLTAPSYEIPDHQLPPFICAAGNDDRLISVNGPILPGFSSAIAGSWQEKSFRWRIEEDGFGQFKMRTLSYDTYSSDLRSGWLSLYYEPYFGVNTSFYLTPYSKYAGFTIESVTDVTTQAAAEAARLAVAEATRQAILSSKTSIAPSLLNVGDEIAIKVYGGDVFLTLVEGFPLFSMSTVLPSELYLNCYFSGRAYDPIRSVLVVDRINSDGSYTFRSKLRATYGIGSQEVYLTAGPGTDFSGDYGDFTGLQVCAVGKEDRAVFEGEPAMIGLNNVVAGTWQEGSFRWRFETIASDGDPKYTMRALSYDMFSDESAGWLSLNAASLSRGIASMDSSVGLSIVRINAVGATVIEMAQAAALADAAGAQALAELASASAAIAITAANNPLASQATKDAAVQATAQATIARNQAAAAQAAVTRALAAIDDASAQAAVADAAQAKNAAETAAITTVSARYTGIGDLYSAEVAAAASAAVADDARYIRNCWSNQRPR